MRAGESNAGSALDPVMASPQVLAGVLGLLFVSALPQVLGVRSGLERRVHSGDSGRSGPAAQEPQRPSLQERRERARTGVLPWGALYTAAVVAFVLYKCLQQGKDEAVPLQEASRKKSLHSDQQLAQLTQQLAQTEQHLNNLMAQLDPLFDRVTTLAGAQQELLNLKLQTIHQLLEESKPNLGAKVTEPAETSVPFPEDLEIEEAEEEIGDCQDWEEPLNCSPDLKNLTAPWGAEQGLRRRCNKAPLRKPNPIQEEARAKDLVKQSLFL